MAENKNFSQNAKKLLTSVIFQCVAVCSVLVLTLVILAVYVFKTGTVTIGGNSNTKVPGEELNSTENGEFIYPYDTPGGPTLLEYADNSEAIGLNISSPNSAFVDASSGKIIASKKSEEKVYPASLTKIMTLIVVVENLRVSENLKDTITISKEVLERMQKEGASIYGFDEGEKISVETALYAMMLKSDGVAATELAIYSAGSEEAFVAKMNEKATSMGLKNTHFANPTGLHDDNHYTTCRDMATILAYAVHNTLCYKIMTTENYSGPYYAKMKNGSGVYKDVKCLPQNKRLTEIKKSYSPEGITYLGCKTGLTDEAKYCFASIGTDKNNNKYLCVTVGANNVKEYCQDHQYIFENYTKK